MRILFAGSPGIAVPSLIALSEMPPPALGAGDTAGETTVAELVGVLTNPDSPRGRKGALEPTEVSAAASGLRLRAGLSPISQIKVVTLGADAREQAAALKADLLVSFAYGRMFGPKFLSLFPRGGINIHPSLLPRHRGPTPIQGAILSGDTETGVSIQLLAPEMDSGDILACTRFPLTGRETAASLSERAAAEAAALLPAVIRGLEAGTLTGRPQTGERTYTTLIAREDGRIDWTRSARAIDARVRAYTPWPLSWTLHREQYLYILKAVAPDTAAGPSSALPGTILGVDTGRGILVQTGEGILALTMLQYCTKKALEWRAFLNGARDFIGGQLGGPLGSALPGQRTKTD